MSNICKKVYVFNLKLVTKLATFDLSIHCTENHIFFFQASWKDGLSKKNAWNTIFLALSGKMIFLFPENMILYLRRKMKNDLSQKNSRKYDIFFKLSEKMVFQKRAALAHYLSCIIWKDGVFFSKTWYFFPGQKVRSGPSQKIHGNTWKYMEIWHFLCTRTGVTNVAPRPSVKKNQRWSYPAKIHLKVLTF